MTRCPICPDGVDHAPEYELPPLLARFEHFISVRGALAKTRDGKVPSRPLARSNVRGITQRAEEILTELGYLTHPAPRIWVGVRHMDVRKLSVKDIDAYLTARFPGDRCRTHKKGCHRCCRPHHVGTYNWCCVFFQKLALFLRYEERGPGGKPVWGADKLASVLAVASRVPYTVRSPEMVPIDTLLRFQAWLVSQENESMQAYGHMMAALQSFGLRYEEMVHAEYPLEGPTVVLDRRRGQLHVLGKGRGGGKERHVTLTPGKLATLDAILAWRAGLGRWLRRQGSEPAPVLFPSTSPHADVRGRPHSERVSAWNRQLRKYAKAYNAAHPEDPVAPDLVSSHKVGRPVFITQLARSKVSQRVGMEEAGIADESTYNRYDRPDLEERRRQVAQADRFAAAANGLVTVTKMEGPIETLDRVIADLGDDAAHVVPILRGVQEMLRHREASR